MGENKSIMQSERECYFCGKLTNLERHHIFGGVANRPISERYGMWVWLCHECHVGQNGAQYDKEKNLKLKQEAQMAFQRIYSKPLWMRLMKKDYTGVK